MNKETFNNCFDAMISSFGYKFDSEDDARLKRTTFFKYLSSNDFDDDLMKRATSIMIGTFKCDYGRKFPSVADLIESVGCGPEQLAKKALTYLKSRAMRYAGNPLVAKETKKSKVMVSTVKNMGGWVKFCHFNKSEEKKRDEEFIKLYIYKYNNNDYDNDIKQLNGPSVLNNKESSQEVCGLIIKQMKEKL